MSVDIKDMSAGTRDRGLDVAIGLGACAVIDSLVTTLTTSTMPRSESGKLCGLVVVIGRCALVLALIMRLVWQLSPSMHASIVFWVFALVAALFWVVRAEYVISKVARLVASIGFCLNAVATLSNGGFMPSVSQQGEGLSIWVPVSETTKCLALCDIYAGCSVGDMLIGVGILVAITGALLRAYRGARD